MASVNIKVLNDHPWYINRNNRCHYTGTIRVNLSSYYGISPYYVNFRNTYTVCSQDNGEHTIFKENRNHPPGSPSCIVSFFITEYLCKKEDKIEVLVKRLYFLDDLPGGARRELEARYTVTKTGGDYEIKVENKVMNEIEGYRKLDFLATEKDNLDSIEVGVFMCELVKWKGDWDRDDAMKD